MKTKMLILALLIAITNGFSNNPIYPDYIPESYVLKFEKEFIETMENQNLIDHIEKNFVTLFDNVTAINAQFSDEIGFYYLVFGEKSNISKIELLIIEEKDYLNEAYTYIDFSNIENLNTIEYCKKGSTNPLTCPVACDYYTDGCLGAVCGVWNGSQCIQQ